MCILFEVCLFVWGRDEHEQKGMLMLTLKTLENVHSAVFAALQRSVDPKAWDVRLALQKTRQQVTHLAQKVKGLLGELGDFTVRQHCVACYSHMPQLSRRVCLLSDKM